MYSVSCLTSAESKISSVCSIMATKNSAQAVFTLTVAAMLDMIFVQVGYFQNVQDPEFGKADDGQGEGEACQVQEERNSFLKEKDCRLLQAQIGQSDGQVPYELAQGAGRGCETREIGKRGAAKDRERSRYRGVAGSRQGA